MKLLCLFFILYQAVCLCNGQCPSGVVGKFGGYFTHISSCEQLCKQNYGLKECIGYIFEAKNRGKCTIFHAGSSDIDLLPIPTVAMDVTQTPEVKSTTQKQSMADEIITNGTFPNGTFTVPVNNITNDFILPGPLQVNITHLNQLGISVDASSMVAETGRMSFFYIRLPPQGSTKFQNIAIRFDNASVLNVFPLSFASKSVSGISRLGSLSDSTTVYQIEITMAKSMCSGVPDGTCRVVYWKPYLILENNISVPGNFSISLPIACGSQCGAPIDSPCASASSSCASCNGQQVSGADTPVTRRYNMGRSSGSFNFTYMTYTVKDRIKVTYEDRILLDSGCVGTDDFNGTQRRLLSFSGKSQEIRVDIEPNCAGTTGTAWDFIVECINPCSDSSVKVILTAGPTEIKDGGVTYISNEAEMPGLTSYYCYPSTIDWTFNLDYEYDVCAQTCQNSSTCCKSAKSRCSSGNLRYQGSSWSIFKSLRIGGGNATLTWSSAKTNGSIKFQILGTQPSNNIVNKYIAQDMKFYWYLPYLTKDNALLQFDNNGYPLKTKDFGYGIIPRSQPSQNCDDIWSWKQNIYNALVLPSYNSMMTQLNKAYINGSYIYPPCHAVGNCVFNGYSNLAHAEAITRYYGQQNYTSWDDIKKCWRFTENNYVKQICDQLPPTSLKCPTVTQPNYKCTAP